MVYDINDKEIMKARSRGHKLSYRYNKTLDNQVRKRNKIIKELFPNALDGIYIQGPIKVVYGKNTFIGKNFYANFNFTLIDSCKVQLVIMFLLVLMLVLLHQFILCIMKIDISIFIKMV